MTTLLKGRVAIVTGAGRGMGRAIAIKLAQTGADIALVDLEAPLESAELNGPSEIPFAANVSSETAWKRLGEATDEEFGRHRSEHGKLRLMCAAVFQHA